MKEKFYHATAFENVKSILQNGLLVSSSNATNLYGINNISKISEKDIPANYSAHAIFLCNTVTTAESYCYLIEQEHQINHAVVIEFEFDPDIDGIPVEPDPEDPQASVRTFKDIPVAFITQACLESLKYQLSRRTILHSPFEKVDVPHLEEGKNEISSDLNSNKIPETLRTPATPRDVTTSEVEYKDIPQTEPSAHTPKTPKWPSFNDADESHRSNPDAPNASQSSHLLFSADDSTKDIIEKKRQLDNANQQHMKKRKL